MTTLNHEKPTLTVTVTLITIIPILLSISLLCQPVEAQHGPPGQDSGLPNQNFSPSMGVIIIVLIAALFFMGFFSIYIRHCTEVTTTGPGVGTRRNTIGSLARSRRAPRGLDPTVIESFPTFDYASVKTAKIGKGALECAVCLTEFEDDDMLRLIPNCDHVFHPECIDTWLAGHTTCPVCRANLTEPAVSTDSVDIQNDTVLDVTENIQNNEYEITNNNSNCNNEDMEDESMERPLHGRFRRNRSMVRNISFGRPRWMGKFSRSNSTGHVAVRQWENMDRFTLRLPNDVRKQIMSGKLERSTSLVVLPRESSSRRGYRVGSGEGTSRGRSGSVRSDHNVIGRSDRWVFSLAPPFISRAPSVRSPKDVSGTVVNQTGLVRGSIREGSLRGSRRSDLPPLPV